VDLGNPESLKINEEITLSSWIKATNDGNNHSVITRGYAYMINAPYNNLIEFYSHDGTTSNGCAIGWQYDNEWINLVVVIRPYTGGWTIKGYVNGEEVCSGEKTEFNGPRELSELISIGKKGGGGSEQRFFNGQIDDVRIYNRALRPEEIRYLYETTYRE
jgi:hypothetical protein